MDNTTRALRILLAVLLVLAAVGVTAVAVFVIRLTAGL